MECFERWLEGADFDENELAFAGGHWPHERVTAEEQSRNTVENAVFSKLLAMPQAGERWRLVTSAFHMPRAMGTFRQAGFPVEAYPVDWRTRGTEDMLRPFPTLAYGFAQNRHRRARMGRPSGLLADRPFLGLVSRTAAAFQSIIACGGLIPPANPLP